MIRVLDLQKSTRRIFANLTILHLINVIYSEKETILNSTQRVSCGKRNDRNDSGRRVNKNKKDSKRGDKAGF